jgi:hypothetical protein
MTIISVTENTNKEREISVNWPTDQNNKPVTIHMWAEKNLSIDDLERWKECHDEHEFVVTSAIKKGDAWIDGDPTNFVIRWVSVEIHQQHIDTIPKENHRFYLETWARFKNDQASISASSY